MRIVVIGVGHVGLVSAAALARWGHQVVGYDSDGERISDLAGGTVPFFEPGLPALVEEGRSSGALSFTSELDVALEGAAVVFVCVGTPPASGGGPDLSYVEAVGRAIATHATNPLIIVEKSTVPANTGRRLLQVVRYEQQRLGRDMQIEVASNPEFLREGSAVEDTLHPDRIVYGATSEHARSVLREVYRVPIEERGCPVVETDVETAELIKHASNGFLATRISFINAVANICERVGADVETVATGMGLDARIGRHFLNAGLGYGGSCFPKDVDAFAHLARQVGYEFGLLDEVRAINEGQRHAVLRKLENELWHLEGKVITLLGAAFKPGTDDLREAPAIHLAADLLQAGAEVRIYDPVALENVARECPDAKRYDDPLSALTGAHAAVVATEWPQIAALEPADFRRTLAYPIVIDGRNVYDPATFIASGVRYHSVGRRSVT
jgi:UDPglucose 6-dehydrogenase